MRVSLLSALVLSLSLCGCQVEEKRIVPTVEIGVFYGGQIQRAKRVETSKVRPPKIGFRVSWADGKERHDSVVKEVLLSFEITRPGPSGRRVKERGTLKLARSQDRVDRILSLDPSDKLGVWNIRVIQADRILADRALYLVSAP